MTTQEISNQLTRPFSVKEVRFKPLVVKGQRALASAYIDCRCVQERLDEVLGLHGWADDYSILDDGSVVCRLSVCINSTWITRCDVGSPSEQPDAGDRLKAAFSDALKRAAVKFGVGRYLYRLPLQWQEYDPVKKQFSKPPTLPAWALPIVQEASTNPASVNATSPSTGEELLRRVADYEQKLVASRRCDRGILLEHLRNYGQSQGWPVEIQHWPGEVLPQAVQAVKAYAASLASQHNNQANAA